MRFTDFLIETELGSQAYPWMYDNRKDIKLWIQRLCRYSNRRPASFSVEPDLKVNHVGITGLELSVKHWEKTQFLKKNKIPYQKGISPLEIDPDILRTRGHELMPKIFVHSNGVTAIPVMFDTVEGDFSIDYPVTTLIGSPREITDGGFFVYNSFIRDLKGFPKRVTDSVDITSHEAITDFTGMDPDTHIGASVSVNFKEIGSFVGISKSITYLSILCPVRSMKGLETTKLFYLSIENPNCGGLLSLLKCRDLRTIKVEHAELRAACDIILKHLKEDQDIVTCKRELIAAGLEKFAKI